MIVAIGATKGGVGKTTLAVNLTIWLASLGYDVLLIDGDEQRTASAFTELRASKKETGYTAIELSGAAIRTQCRQMKAKYSHIVIDVGGRDSTSLRAALTVAETILIPVQPRSFDLWAIDQMAELIAEAREINGDLRAMAVLNQADPQGRDNGDARDYIEKVPGLELALSKLIRRKAYPNAAAEGLGVFEFWDKDQKESIVKAREDLSGLLGTVFGFNHETRALTQAAAGER